MRSGIATSASVASVASARLRSGARLVAALTASARRNPGPASLLLVALVLLAHAAVNVCWVRHDLSFRAYDAAPHFDAHIFAHTVVAQEGLGGLLRVIRPPASGWWPSAGYVPWLAATLPLGPRLDALELFNLVFLAILLFSTYSLGARLHSRGAGVLAAVVVGLYPGVYGESRQVGVDFPAAALTAACVLLLLRTRRLCDTRRAVVFGATVGAAVLVRPQVALFMLAPGAVLLALSLRRAQGRRGGRIGRPLLNAAAAVGAALAVSAVWWWGRVGRILALLARHQLDGDLLSHNSEPALLFYGRMLPWLCSPWLLLALVAAGVGWWRGRPAARVAREGRPDAAVLAAWLAGGVVVLWWLSVHFLRFLLPLAPALALFTAAGLLSAPRRRIRAVLVGMVVSVATLCWLTDSLWVQLVPSSTIPWTGRVRPKGLTNGPPYRDGVVEAVDAAGRRLARGHEDGRLLTVHLGWPPARDWQRLVWIAAPWIRAHLPRAVIVGVGHTVGGPEDLSFVRVNGTVMPLVRHRSRRNARRLVYFHVHRADVPGQQFFPRDRREALWEVGENQVPWIDYGRVGWVSVWR